jgi:DNA processing protein
MTPISSANSGSAASIPGTQQANAPWSEERLAWLALALTPGLGPRRILQVVEKLDTAGRIFRLALTELESLALPAQAAQFLFEGKARAEAEAEWKRVYAEGGSLLTYSDSDYPERLKEIYDPPAVLWIRGDRSLLSRPSLAVVGTRHPTPYGAGMAEMLSRDLALRKLLILSGMARGVDTAAHNGALAAKAPTIAIWGTGIDVIYPKENKSLAERILLGGGAIVSEYRMGTFPAPQNFPRRNRLLSGMSVGVLVVEAAETSGTRVTARCALEQNRDVYAVPGNVTSKNAWGPNTLIKQGATLVATWEDVWEDLPTQIRIELEEQLEAASNVGVAGAPASNVGAGASLFTDAPLAPNETIVLQALHRDEALQLDEIMEKLEDELTSSEVFTALFELELAGRIKSLPGKNYVRSF